MVKGVSKQVIVVHSPDPKLFEQAIFILKENAGEVTQAQLLQEARLAVRQDDRAWDRGRALVCTLAGACLTAILWMITLLF